MKQNLSTQQSSSFVMFTMTIVTLFFVLSVSAQQTYSSLKHLTVTNIRNIDGSGQTLISSSDPSSPYYSSSKGNLKSENGMKSTMDNEIITIEGCTFDLNWFGFPSENEKTAIKAGLGNAVKDRSISNSGNPVKVSITADYGMGNTLASTATDWALTDYISGIMTWYPAMLVEHILGENSNGSDYDISIQYNAILTWDLSTEGGSAGSNPNLMYIIMHEFSHGMGVSSSAAYNVGLYTLGWSGSPNVFDLNLEDINGDQVWGNENYQSSTQLEALFTSDIFFEDINLYDPNPWSGQSISHLEGYTGSNQLMLAFYNPTIIYTIVGSKVNQIHSTNGWVSGGSTTPVAEFYATPTSGTATLTVNFTDLSTNTPTSWSWTFGDGGTSPDQNPTYVYNTPGVYTVQLTATNSAGSDDKIKTDYITVTVAVLTPVAEFYATPTSGTATLTVNFTDLSTNTPTNWSWTFGDGGTSPDQNPTYVYNTPGVYTVQLTATNSAGSDDEIKTDYITVTVAVLTPVAEFSANTTSGEAPLSVIFTDQSTNTPTSWSWTFGDGGTSTSQNPTYVYNTPDVYTVSLTASNSAGSDTETKTDYITIYNPILANAGTDMGLEVGQSVQFEGSYFGGSGDVSILWKGVDNTVPIFDPEDLNSFVGPFTEVDIYYFVLTITDNITGSVSTDTMFVDVITGVNELMAEDISVYPNPTSNKVQIKFVTAMQREIVLINALGRQCFKGESTENIKSIDISQFITGWYILRIMENNTVVKEFKVTKQ